MPTMLTLKEVAEAVGCSTARLEQFVTAGDLVPSWMLGSTRGFDEDAIERARELLAAAKAKRSQGASERGAATIVVCHVSPETKTALAAKAAAEDTTVGRYAAAILNAAV